MRGLTTVEHDLLSVASTRGDKSCFCSTDSDFSEGEERAAEDLIAFGRAYWMAYEGCPNQHLRATTLGREALLAHYVVAYNSDKVW